MLKNKFHLDDKYHCCFWRWGWNFSTWQFSFFLGGGIFGQISILSTIFLTKFAVLGAKLVKFWTSQFSSKTPEVHKLS